MLGKGQEDLGKAIVLIRKRQAAMEGPEETRAVWWLLGVRDWH